jgi:large subunit ribosomal protein L4
MADIPEMEAPKTRDLVAFLAGVGLDGKTLVLTNGKNDNLYLSSRNLPGVNVLAFGNESVYDVLWAHTVVIERSALEAISEATVEADAEEADDA